DRKAVPAGALPRRRAARDDLIDTVLPPRLEGRVTKADLVAIIAKSSGGSKTAAERAMEAMVGGIVESLRRGRRVTISGFGTFIVTKRAARNGRNPRTGQEIQIPPARVPRFRPSRTLKTAIR